MLEQHGRPSEKNPFPSSPQEGKHMWLPLPSRINPAGPSITWLRNHPSGRQTGKRKNYPFNEIVNCSSQKAHSCYSAAPGLCYICQPFSPLLPFPSLCLCSGSWPELKNTLFYTSILSSRASAHSLKLSLMHSCLQIVCVFSLPFLHLSPLGSCWDLQLDYPGFFFLKSNKIVLNLSSEFIIKFFC